MWSEPPRHYTYMYVRSLEGQPRRIEFKDSSHGEVARTVATRILRNLRLIEPHEEAPLKSNKKHQEDGWSCGLWSCRWVERQLRENRGEARMVPMSFAEMRSRTNEFISKIKDVKGVGKKDETKAGPRTYETHELARDSFEKALEAAIACSKWLPTKAGTKVCRACMGDRFETIRQRKARGA